MELPEEEYQKKIRKLNKKLARPAVDSLHPKNKSE
jgi:hypothetical protein